MMSRGRDSSQIRGIKSSNDKPLDTVQVLEFIDDKVFVSGSWAGILRIYKITSDKEIVQVKKGIKIGVPIFKILYLGNYEVLVGCGDGSLVAANLESGQVKLANSFKSSIIGLFETEYDRNKLIVVVESRGLLHVSSLRDKNLSVDVDLEDTIIDCDVVNGLVGLIFPESHYYFGDLRDLIETKCHRKRKSPLNQDLCFIRIDPKGVSLMIIDQLGRANYLLIQSPITKEPESKIIYSTLREEKHGKSIYHSPTAIAYCGIGSGDLSQCVLVANSTRNITIWNCIQKHQGLNIKSGNLDETVTAAAFNKKVNLLVFATGYCWNLGVSGINGIKSGPNIFFKCLGRSDFNDC